MLVFPAASSTSAPSFSLHFLRRHRNPPFSVLPIYFFSPFANVAAESTRKDQPEAQPHSGNYAGVRLEEKVGKESERSRIDAWISSRVPGVSRVRIQSSIRSGLVTINGRRIEKVSHKIKVGDNIDCVISELQPLSAEPEDISIDIVYEDDHVLVVNKPPHMVVHPAPGNPNGTLVNAILHHCRLPVIQCRNSEMLSEVEDVSQPSDDEVENIFACNRLSSMASVRPGIVHRLDKGTSGLLVVAKDEYSHAHLAEQFKCHTIHRVYISLTAGVPSPKFGCVEVPIARDSKNRIRMAAVPGAGKNRNARHAVSRYKVVEVLASGGSALVEWRLETGRTHQIRAHAKHLGIPLLGDEVYGGTKGLALSLIRAKTLSSYHGSLSHMLSRIERPCLHALSLGFKHPHSGEDIRLSCSPPSDFSDVLAQLRNANT